VLRMMLKGLREQLRIARYRMNLRID
jgi:hypothetical protein